MKSSKAVVTMVGLAFVIAIGAMGGRAANAATPTVGLGTSANFSVVAGTEVTNTATPTATVAAAGPTVAPTAAPAAGVRSLPSTSTGDPGPLTILGTALAGVGCLLLVRRPVRHP